jgi:hypothetical protein
LPHGWSSAEIQALTSNRIQIRIGWPVLYR